ncbi:MAG: CBS domain-containing protein, partial [Methanomassiliicoccales archaeon]
MKASLRVGRIMGIPINIHVTFLIILPLFAFVFATSSVEVFGFRLGFGDLEVDLLTKGILGTVAAIVFFVSVLIHELAHSYVALRNGYKISGITLFIFGGVSQIEETPARAPGEALMAFVGPAASFLVGIVFIPIALAIDALGSGLVYEAGFIAFGLIGFYNILLGAFNLLPAFPMDGGRILRALLARRMSFSKATQTAASIGRAFAIGMAIFGLFYNFILIIIAIFIYFGAGEEEKSTRISESLQGMKVRDLMTTDVSSVPSTMTLTGLLDKMLAEKHMGYPVVDGGRLVGVVTLNDASKVPREEQDSVTVERVMSHQVSSVSPETDAMDAVKTISSRRIGRLIVMQDGDMVGIVTRTDL